MALNTRVISIVGAVVVSAGLITGAFALSGPLPFASLIKKVDAQSTEALLKTYASKDTDADGLPDWEESLYGTDPSNPQSVRDGLSDMEAVMQGLVQPKFVSEASMLAQENSSTDVPDSINAQPNSLTDRFARAFFQNYINGRGTERPSQEEILKFVNDAVIDLSQERENSQHYTINQVKTGESGSEAMRTYIVQAENSFLKYPTKSGAPELTYVTEAVNGDTSSLDKARDIARRYRSQADDLMTLSVPPEARFAHLALANSMYKLGEVTDDMAAMDTDPLLGMLGIIDYQKVALQAVRAFAQYPALLSSAGVSFSEGEDGYFFYYRSVMVADLLHKAEAGQPIQ